MIFVLCYTINIRYMIDYLLSILKKIKFQLILITETFDIEFNKDDTYIFVQIIEPKFLQKLDDTYKNIYLINTEQLSVQDRREKINSRPSFINMIDYLDTNLKYYNSNFNTYLLPYQINHDEIYNLSKTEDICIIKDLSSNRKHIIDRLQIEKNIKVNIIEGWQKERDEILFKHKILLNISYFAENNCKVLETFRCDRCIYNKMIVISDMKDDIESYYLKDHMLFVEYDKIPDIVQDVLQNYEYYYNKLFENFDYQKIDDRLNTLSKRLIEKL